MLRRGTPTYGVKNNHMKVKEELGPRRGRPRKFSAGETEQRNIRAPENLLMELRVAARLRGVSTNDEIISRLIQSMDFTPRKPVIKTEEGERLMALARLFDEFIQARVEEIREKYRDETPEQVGKKTFIPGPMRMFSCSFPVRLRDQMIISARFNQQSTNHEIYHRLLASFNYLTDQQLPENEEVHRLRSLAMMFDEFVISRVSDAERSRAPWLKKD